MQRAVFDLIQAAGRKAPDHVELDYGHGRVIEYETGLANDWPIP